MVVYTTLTISGLTVPDAYDIKVEKTLGDTNAASSFTAIIDNTNGVNAGSYTLGNEVIIYADKDVNPPTTKIFTGILEDVQFKGTHQQEKITLSGRDYTARLQDRTIEPEVYTNLPAGSIVRDIINKYVDDITVNNVQDSSTVISRIAFNHIPVFDGIKQLATLADYTFYVDVDKDLHFEPKSSVSSGKIFSSGNIINSSFKTIRDTVFNEVWVYGDRYLDNYRESFTADGTGSVFTLLYKPHNTEVTVNGTTKVGGIYRMTTIPPSGTHYLVNYHDKQIIFVSGTSIGNSIPASGASVVVKYDRALPIIKVGRDNSSIATYGKRVKTIVDKNIKDPTEAETRVSKELEENSSPKKEGTLYVRGVVDVEPSQTCVVHLPWHGINNQVYDIISAKYNFTKEKNLAENVLTIKVNKKLTDITDKIKELDERLRRIEGTDIDPTDVLTRLEFATGSLLVVGSYWQVSVRSIAGTNLILDSPSFGLLDTYRLASGTTTSFVLGHALAGVLGTSTLGQVESTWQVVYSGGSW